MLQRPLYLILLLTASVVVPYLSSGWKKFAANLPTSEGAGPSSAPAVTPGTTAPAPAAGSDAAEVGTASAPSGTTAQLTAVPAPDGAGGDASALPAIPNYDLNQVLDFNLTPEWITAMWPRVSTRLAPLDLQGYRVPLVTGTRPDDLAGALTYYFDRDQQLARITFQGTTGDSRRLASLLEAKFGFRQQLTSDPHTSLYQVKWNGKPRGQLWVQSAQVIRADSPLSRFEIRLSIDRPSRFSPYARQLISGSKRWPGAF